MTIAAHPSDTLAFRIDYTSAAGVTVPENAPTAWTAEDASGTTVAFVNITVDPTSDQAGTATLSGVGDFVLHADMGTVHAQSDTISVSEDNTPTQGVIQVTVTPVAP